MTPELEHDLKAAVRTIPDYPKPGILFRDITPLLRTHFNATLDTLVVGSSHYVPNVPNVLWRVDLNAHGELFRIGNAPVTGRAGVGYTLLAGRHVNDAIVAPTNNVLNALVSARYRFVEIGFDMYNVLGLMYPDDEEYYVSNWSFQPGQNRASGGVHIVAAPPRTALGTLGLYF